MPTVKLNKALKESICTRLLKQRFKDDVEKIMRRYIRLTDRIYKDAIPKRDRDRMEALPKGWMRTVTGVRVRFAGEDERFSFNADQEFHGPMSWILKSSERPENEYRLMADSKINAVLKVYDPQDQLCKVYEELEADKDELERRIRTAKTGIDQALNQRTTLKSLVRDWPEVEPFVRDYMNQEDPVLPALPVVRLNEALNLKPQPAEKEAA